MCIRHALRINSFVVLLFSFYFYFFFFHLKTILQCSTIAEPSHNLRQIFTDIHFPLTNEVSNSCCRHLCRWHCVFIDSGDIVFVSVKIVFKRIQFFFSIFCCCRCCIRFKQHLKQTYRTVIKHDIDIKWIFHRPPCTCIKNMKFTNGVYVFYYIFFFRTQ